VLQTQQVASSRLRAVETGRWVVQAAPTGFSAFVSPSGDVHQRTGVSERAVIIREIDLRSGRTWYVTLGDWPWILAVLIVFLISVWYGGARVTLPRKLASLRSRRQASPDHR
jgi:apolipoprotein N-acyltransferase